MNNAHLTFLTRQISQAIVKRGEVKNANQENRWGSHLLCVVNVVTVDIKPVRFNARRHQRGVRKGLSLNSRCSRRDPYRNGVTPGCGVSATDSYERPRLMSHVPISGASPGRWGHASSRPVIVFRHRLSLTAYLAHNVLACYESRWA